MNTHVDHALVAEARTLFEADPSSQYEATWDYLVPYKRHDWLHIAALRRNRPVSVVPTTTDEPKIDPCNNGDHYHCDMRSEVGWKADTQTISVKCCCGMTRTS